MTYFSLSICDFSSFDIDGKPAGKPDLSPDKMKEVLSGLDEAEKEKIKSLLDAVKNGEKDQLTELASK